MVDGTWFDDVESFVAICDIPLATLRRRTTSWSTESSMMTIEESRSRRYNRGDVPPRTENGAAKPSANIC